MLLRRLSRLTIYTKRRIFMGDQLLTRWKQPRPDWLELSRTGTMQGAPKSHRGMISRFFLSYLCQPWLQSLLDRPLSDLDRKDRCENRSTETRSRACCNPQRTREPAFQTSPATCRELRRHRSTDNESRGRTEAKDVCRRNRKPRRQENSRS